MLISETKLTTNDIVESMKVFTYCRLGVANGLIGADAEVPQRERRSHGEPINKFKTQIRP
jgi:hypothetical protein